MLSSPHINSYPVRAINVLKASGGSARESCLLPGYALNMGRAAQGMPTRVVNARIALLDMNLQKARMQMGIQVLVNDPAELEKIRERESDITKERIQKILDAGANVILTTKGIDDMALKYFVEAGALACRRVSKDDIKCVGVLMDRCFLSAHMFVVLTTTPAGAWPRSLGAMSCPRWQTWRATRRLTRPTWAAARKLSRSGWRTTTSWCSRAVPARAR